jgi:small nuclear ribonucleoprotein (snRNP)-like protein
MGKYKIIAFIFLLTGFFLSADVIRMKDGRVFIGRVLTVDPSGVVILAYDQKVTVDYGDILKTAPNFNSIKNRELEITLKDNSVMRGKVKDYDSDIGLFMEIEFGQITIPLENIKSIDDPEQRSKQLAHFAQIGAQGGFYFIIGDLNTVFSSNFTVDLFSEFNLGFLLQGLFAGACLSYHNLSAIDYTDYSYLMVNLQAYGMYRFLMLRSMTGFLRNLVPFVSAGVGVACPVQTYNEESAFELDLSFTGSVGIDYFLFDDLLIRASGCWMSVMQSKLWYNSVTIKFGAAYCF